MKGIYFKDIGVCLYIFNSDYICDNMNSNIIKYSNEVKIVGERYEFINLF